MKYVAILLLVLLSMGFMVAPTAADRMQDTTLNPGIWWTTPFVPRDGFDTEFGPFTFSSTSSMLLRIVIACPYDQVAVYDNGVLIGQTSAPHEGSCFFGGGDQAWSNPSLGKAEIVLSPGSHAINFETLVSPFNGGTITLRWDGTSNPETPTYTPTNTPTNTATNTPVPPTNTPTNTATNTATNTPTNTATNTATNTPVPPTNTATNTATNTPTNTPVPPTNTPTNTPRMQDTPLNPGVWLTTPFVPRDGFDTEFGPFTFSSTSSMLLRIVIACPYDQVAVYDNGVLIGQTSAPHEGSCFFGGGDQAWSNPSLGKAEIVLSPGSHAINFETLVSPFNGGTITLRWDRTSNPETPTNTPTNTATNTPTNTATNTATNTPTNTAT
ncbi:MAG: hypothetical protein ABI835_16835, partial [Chloroflexota bacterium]